VISTEARLLTLFLLVSTPICFASQRASFAGGIRKYKHCTQCLYLLTQIETPGLVTGRLEY
jgi:hypothetical protein